MNKRLQIDYNLDMDGHIFDEQTMSELNDSCLTRIKEQISLGVNQGELIECIGEYTFYGYFFVTSFNFEIEKAINEIKKVTDKQIVWKREPFPHNHLLCERTDYVEYYETTTCVYAYLKPQ
jgi:hypothetical protein